MSRPFKVLQLQPDYNVKSHDFADLAEQIVKALPADRYEVTAAFCGAGQGLQTRSAARPRPSTSSFPTSRSRA